MNERIKELEKQSLDYFWSLDDSVRTTDTFTANSEFTKKFAELIVRECATKANATALDLRIRPELDARRYVGDGILKCFGVEE
jgi:hypothetical protein